MILLSTVPYYSSVSRCAITASTNTCNFAHANDVRINHLARNHSRLAKNGKCEKCEGKFENANRWLSSPITTIDNTKKLHFRYVLLT